MTRQSVLTGVFFTAILCIPTGSRMIPSACSQNIQTPSYRTSEFSEDKMAALPLLFRENKGQWDEKILYSGSSHSANVYFMKNELSFGFTRRVEKEETEEGEEAEMKAEVEEIQYRAYHTEPKRDFEYLVWNVRFEGANPEAAMEAEGQADSKANYLLGNDPDKHYIHVPDYKLLKYKNIYDHIDLHYYGSSKRLKYDFIIKPFGNAGHIKMLYRGIKKIRVNKRGELVLQTAWGEMKEEAPYSYQYINGKKTEIKSSYVLLNDSTVGFKILQPYATDQELIIDPIVLDWATFVAGTISAPSMSGQVSKIAMDAQGNVYAVGSYNATFPTTPGSYSTTFGGGNQDVFVFKINPTGTALVYSTYIGGNQWDTGTNLYLNATGEVYVVGQTSSFNWPTLNAYDNTYNGVGDIFACKLNAAGSALLFSTFIGGSNGSDMGSDIALDPSQNVYIVGNTSSTNFPTSAGAFSSTLKGYSDMVVCKLSPGGNTLLYSTLIGSSKSETGVGIAANAAGEATVGGNSDSTDFPTTPGAYDVTENDAPNIYNMKGDMVIFKLNPNASALVYSTYLGSNVGDFMQGFDVNSSGDAYVAGVILFGTNYPTTPGAFSTTVSIWNSFVTRLNNTGTALVYSTFFSTNTSQLDEVRDLYVNASDEAYVAGDGGSYNQFPITTPTCTTCQGGEDIFAAKLSANGSSVLWGTYIGSKDWDICQAIAVNKVNCQERVALGFNSNSFVFPTTPGVFQPNKLSTDSTNTQPGIIMFADTTITASGTANAGADVTICAGANITLSGTGSGTSYAWSPGGQTTTSIAVSPTTTTTYSFSVTNSCGTTTDSVKVTVNSSITAAIAGNTSICSGQSATLTASGGGTYSWSTGATTTSITATATSTTSYSVIVSSGSCPADTATVTLTVSAAPSVSITGNSVLCSGQNSTLTASGGATYSWNTGATTSALTITPTSSTTYTIIANNGNGCTVTATHSVTVLPALAATVSSTQAGCTVNNGTATANPSSGTPGYTYAWSNGQSTQTATGLAVGNYTVLITDAGGCTKSQTVTVSSNSTLGASAVSTQSGCSVNNGTATANASNGTPGYTYSWNNGQTTQTATGLGAGSYTATVTDANGCSVAATVSVSALPGPTATAAAAAVSIVSGTNTTLTATGGGTYLWTPAAGLSCTTCANPTATPSQTTHYCVTVTDANNCTDSSCVTIYVEIPCGNLYIPNAFSPNDDLENDWECVMGECIKAIHLFIYNRWGELVFESNDQKICWDGSYKGRRLDTAVFSYYLEVTLTSGSKTIKTGNISLVQ